MFNERVGAERKRSSSPSVVPRRLSRSEKRDAAIFSEARFRARRPQRLRKNDPQTPEIAPSSSQYVALRRTLDTPKEAFGFVSGLRQSLFSFIVDARLTRRKKRSPSFQVCKNRPFLNRRRRLSNAARKRKNRASQAQRNLEPPYTFQRGFVASLLIRSARLERIRDKRGA